MIGRIESNRSVHSRSPGDGDDMVILGRKKLEQYAGQNTRGKSFFVLKTNAHTLRKCRQNVLGLLIKLSLQWGRGHHEYVENLLRGLLLLFS